MSDATAGQLPPGLAAVAADFADTPREMRLELLLEYADRLKPLPEPYASQTDLMERVEECQSPLFAIAEVNGDSVQIHATAPQESPTTRAFASIMQLGLNGLTRINRVSLTTTHARRNRTARTDPATGARRNQRLIRSGS